MADLLSTHRDLLERWRKSMNLVGPGDVQNHYDDCRLALHWMKPEGRWVDLGSGAGFPGIVFAAMFPHLQVDLVDSRKKRCIFLQTALGEAGVPTERVQVHRVRVETLEGPWDGIMSRAFAPPEAVLDHAERLLREGGTLILFLQEEAVIPERQDWQMFHVEQSRLSKEKS